MTTIVGLDPSVLSAGIAVLTDGVLVGCWRAKFSRKLAELSRGDRVCTIGHAVVADLRSHMVLAVHTLVFEWPQIYGVGVSKVDPNTLIALAAIGTAVGAELPQAEIVTPTPREWCGGTSKNTDGSAKDSNRWRRLELILTPAEQALVPDQHDVIDAVAIALHATPRALALGHRVRTRGRPKT